MSTASPARRLLFAAATSDRLERLVQEVPGLRNAAFSRARRYVAGDDRDEALTLASRLHGEGFAVSVDFFGEAVRDPAAVEAATDEYVALAGRLDGLPGDTTVAVDLSHLGLDVSPELCRAQLERIAESLGGRRLDVGAETSGRVGATHDLLLGLARSGVSIQATLQANLRRSVDDWPRLAEAGIGIRLVKGAYVEPLARAFPYGEETDTAYVRLAHTLREGGAAFALATHDPVLREALLLALGDVPVEMLVGVRPDDARALVARGVPVRLYAPYGAGWFRYWLRRVAEGRGS